MKTCNFIFLAMFSVLSLATVQAQSLSPDAERELPPSPPESPTAPNAPEKLGFLEIVNASGLAAPVKVYMNGNPLLPDGLTNGDYSGGLIVDAGSAELKLECQGIESLEVRVKIQELQSVLMAVVVRRKVNPKSKEETRHLALQPVGGEAVRNERSYRLWLRNFLDLEVASARFGNQDIFLKRDELREIPTYGGQAFAFGLRGTEPGRFDPSEPGSFVVALIPTPEGTTKAIIFRVNQYSAP